jgi:hypothetical protein
MLNNYLYNIILIIFIALIINLFIKLINWMISYYNDRKDHNVPLWSYMFFTNYYLFVSDLQLKSILELFLMSISDYHYPILPNNFKVSIMFCLIDPTTKKYYPVSDELIFDFDRLNPISSSELYDLIKWDPSKFNHTHDILLLYRIH